MRIGLAFDSQTDATDERQLEFDPPATIQALCDALESLGHAVILLGNARQILVSPARLCEIEIVFNITEGDYARCREAWLPTLLEMRDIPYIGSDPLALSLGLDKLMCKRLAEAAEIRTPPCISIGQSQVLRRRIPLRFPVIVKPRWEGSGRGIDAGAVATSYEALASRVQQMFQHCDGPMLVEEFIPGGELTVLVIGNDPPVALPAIQRPLDPVTGLSYHVVKPAPSTWTCPITLDHALDASAGVIAVRMFEEVSCYDVARVDLRVDEKGRLYFLEINPLPSYDPAGSMGLIAEYLGTTYTDLIGQILNSSLQRLGFVPCNGYRHRCTDKEPQSSSLNLPHPTPAKDATAQGAMSKAC